MPVGLASGLPAGWEWDYDGTRWFYTFKANGHIQYHFPSEGDEFPDFVDVGEPVPDLKPEERLESNQQVKRVTGVAPVVEKKRKTKRGAENSMMATGRPVGIEWDGDVGEDSSGEEDGAKKTVFQPENLMFLGPQTYAEVSPLNEEEEEEAKRTVVGVVKGRGEGVVSPADTTVGTPAGNKAELVKDVAEAKNEEEENGKNEAVSEVVMPVMETTTVREGEAAREEEAKPAEERAKAPTQQASAIVQVTCPPAQQDPVVSDAASEAVASTASPPLPQSVSAHLAAADTPTLALGPVVEAAAPITSPPLLQRIPAPVDAYDDLAILPLCPVVRPQQQQQQQQPRYELPAPDTPFNPVGVIAEMPTEDTPRSHIEINPIPVEIMDTSVLAPIEIVTQPPPLGIAESSAAVVKQTPAPPKQQQQRSGGTSSSTGGMVATPPRIQMKIRRKPTDPNASIPSPLSASSASAVMSPVVVSPPSVASPSPVFVPSAPTPPPSKPQYKPYAPVSPLHRADTEPVRVSTKTAGIAAQQEQQSVTQPPSPVANPQLSYAPTVLRPAGQSRKSWSVSPERKQNEGGAKRGNGAMGSLGGGQAQNGKPDQGFGDNAPASPGSTCQQQISLQGQTPLQALMAPLGYSPQPHQTLPQGQIPSGQVLQQGQAHLQGPVSSQGPRGLQGQGPPQWQAPQNAMQPPIQRDRPMSMAPGQYPPVPIPQPYRQYQQQPPRMNQQPGHPQAGQRPGPPWLAPGQQISSQDYAISHQQQQPPPGWMRQSMPPGLLSGQQTQQPPNGRHSMMAPDNRLNQYQQTSGPVSCSKQPHMSRSHHQAPIPDSSVISPPRPRADSQPSGASMPGPSLIKAPQSSSIRQPAVSALPQETLKPGSVKVDTGPNTKGSTADSDVPFDKDHPVDLVGTVADQFAAEMQVILGSGSDSSNAPKSANSAEAKPEPKTLVETLSPGPGRELGRIEEHDADMASVSAGSRPSSVATKLSQPQQPTPSQQSSLDNTPKPPQGFLPLPNGHVGAAMQGPQAGLSLPRQMTPGQMMPAAGPVGSQGRMPPQDTAAQQQWQGNMQRPLSVPPQLQMQPNTGKGNKWTKWFKSSKPEKKPDTLQVGVLQQQPISQGWGQPQQLQGQPMMGHAMPHSPMQGQPIQEQLMQGQSIARQSVQGHPMQGQPMHGQPGQGQKPLSGYPMPVQPMQRHSAQGQPVQGPPLQGPPLQGQPLRGAVVGSPMPLQSLPSHPYPPHQMSSGPGLAQLMAPEGPVAYHPPQQYVPPLSGQPMQMRPPHGSGMQQQMQPGEPMMQTPHTGGPGLPAASQMSSRFPPQSSVASSAQIGFRNGPQQQQAASPTPSNLMPAPLSLRPRSEVPTGMPGGGQLS